MSDINYQIDLDALFDALNVGGNQSGKSKEASGEIVVSCPDMRAAVSYEMPSLDTDLFCVDQS